MKGFKILRYFLIVVVIGLCLSGCESKVNKEEIAEELLKDIPTLIFANETTLNLVSEYQGQKITWKFDKSDYIDENGNFIEPSQHDATLKLNVYVNNKLAGTKNITLSRNLNNYFGEIETYVRSFIKDRSRGDLRLKTDYYGYPDIEISYVSSKPEIVDHTGKYYEHEYDENITFDVAISYRGKIYEFQVEHISIGRTDLNKITIIDEWLQEEVQKLAYTDGMELPTTHPLYGGRIRWICEEPYVVLNNKDFFLPLNAGRYMMMVEVNFPGSYDYFTYFVDLPATTVTDPIERAKRFIEVATPEEIDEFFVLYDGTTPEITRHIIGDDAKYQVHAGEKPAVPQSVLDQRMYEGYTMPNEDNILWIVVHETGMKTVGLFAEVFDNTQWNRAYGNSKPDSVSWHYTVDDNKIIQNYEDNIAAWHAGDVSTIGGGNRNGIGIEMCINADGEYDASLRNDARLVASLLIKYNLNMANVKRHRDFMLKDCPETMIKDRRWFEFLDLVAKEYISQTLLAQFEITYEIEANTAVEAWVIDGIYQKVDNSKDTLSIVAKFVEEEVALAIKLN